MSVIVTFRIKADPQKLEEFADANRDEMRGVLEAAKEHGAIAHRFYGSDDGQLMVVDEWPDRESFQSFFEANRARIEPMFGGAGASGEPEVIFWRKLETHDELGWGA